MDIFVTGTDTGVGKTVLAAMLVAALRRGYWKPIQTGRAGGSVRTDRESVIAWTGLDPSSAPPEACIFDPPVSPHQAAREAGVRIEVASISRPPLGRRLVIEGAGGVMVPINDERTMLDLMAHLGAPIVVASRTSLGTLNHTFLTVEAVRRRGLALLGVVLIGEEHTENRRTIERRVPVVGWIPPLGSIDAAVLVEVFDRRFDRAAFPPAEP
jgi:dethiobiotin synthase